MLDLRASLLSDQGHFEQAAELLDAGDRHLRRPPRAAPQGAGDDQQGAVPRLRRLARGGDPPDPQGSRPDRLGARAAPGADGAPQPRLVPQRLRPRPTRRCASSSASATPTASSPTPGPSSASPGSTAASPPAWGAAKPPSRPCARSASASSPSGYGYDAALVTLDLAHLYLEAGRTAEVRVLADGAARPLPLPGHPPPGARRPRRLPEGGRAGHRHARPGAGDLLLSRAGAQEPRAAVREGGGVEGRESDILALPCRQRPRPVPLRPHRHRPPPAARRPGPARRSPPQGDARTPSTS